MTGEQSLTFDVASAVALGKRDTQEDAIVADVPRGSDVGFVVLADGMGGHNAGDIASKIVVTEVYSALKEQGQDMTKDPTQVRDALRKAAFAANDTLAKHAQTHPQTKGMGTTLVGAVLLYDALFWISIGDSVLYLLRNGKLSQLNQDHSLAPQIDYMVKQGLMSEEAGRNHPDRNCLTSALRGEEIPFIDCPERPMRLIPGDVVMAASDGLPFLPEDQITRILTKAGSTESATLAEHFLQAIDRLDHPEQDNVCFSVVRVGAGKGAVDAARPRDVTSAIEAEPVIEHAPIFSFLNKLRVFRSTGVRR